MKLPNAYDTIIAALFLLVLINGYALTILPEVIASAVVAVLAAVAAEAIIEYIKTKKIIFSKSAIASGLIIASIVQYGWFDRIVLAAALAILLKKIIIKDNMPVFNPASLGLFIVFLFSGGSGEVWWGNTVTVAVLILGIAVSWRIKKLYISAAYLLAFVLLNIAHPAFDITFLPLFSAFFMLTEPKTTPVTRGNQLVFGVLAAGIIHGLTLLHAPSAFLLGLLLSNGIGKLFLR